MELLRCRKEDGNLALRCLLCIEHISERIDKPLLPSVNRRRIAPYECNLSDFGKLFILLLACATLLSQLVLLCAKELLILLVLGKLYGLDSLAGANIGDIDIYSLSK